MHSHPRRSRASIHYGREIDCTQSDLSGHISGDTDTKGQGSVRGKGGTRKEMGQKYGLDIYPSADP